ncbi:hypothetical protein AL755_09470 [Arthrobacter sp. ERGS1:01]|uniref:hypothetical protein n=1 Tax=Arthrobacter sp. ERGS1:01 TaxID=1704044 RepID=UPI0006B4D062|nr:hypothetical protein [Arthrobacter sp. ERGS1:01]ALE05655.1 hypothetical protein AL755_09470 [Arthrobacter sp. ERGS1:01]
MAFRQLFIAARDIPDFDVISAHQLVVDGALLGSGQGVVPGLGNVDPRGYRNLVDAAGTVVAAAEAISADMAAKNGQ